MGSKIVGRSEGSFDAAEQEWNLPKLYVDLAVANGRSLSGNAKRFLRGILLGLSPSEIARECGYKGKEPSRVVRAVLARDVYPCILILLQLPENLQVRWGNVPQLLNQYRRTKVKEPKSLIYLSNELIEYKDDSISNKIKSEILRELLKKYFLKYGFTENVLSNNIKVMDFRNDWQFIVNKLVSETKETLKAMVFDTELKKWWSSIAGMTYMATNVGLLKKGINIQRIFILSSSDLRIRSHALMNAYLHNKIGIHVKVIEKSILDSRYFFNADMFSVHDKDFIAIYYFSLEEETVHLMMKSDIVMTFISFYNELFNDDRLCRNIDEVLSNEHIGCRFILEIDQQIEMLRKISSMSSMIDFLRFI